MRHLAVSIGLALAGCSPMGNSLIRIDTTDASQTPASEAYVDILVDAQRFFLLHFDLGVMAVAIDTIRQTAEGSEVVLEFGNTTAAGLVDPSVTLWWGPVDASKTPLLAEERSREVSLGNLFAPASWTRVLVALPNVAPSEIAFLRLIGFDFTELKLRSS